MYRKLRKEFPQIAGKIQPLARMVKDRYPVILGFRHPMGHEVNNALRGWRTTGPLTSPTPLSGRVEGGGGQRTSYTQESARLLYRRMLELKSEWRCEWDHINVYAESLDQAREWIQWGLDLENQRLVSDHGSWFYYVKAVDQSVTVGEITRKQQAFRDYQYYVKFYNHQFTDDVKLQQFKNILQNAQPNLLMNASLNNLFKDRPSNWSYPRSLFNCDLYARNEGDLMILQLAFGHLIKKIYRVKYLGK